MPEAIPIDAKQRATEAQFSRDTLQNLVTGMGGSNDPASATRHIFRLQITPLEAEAMYVNDWLGAAVINAIPDDMIREWREIKGLEAKPLEEYEAAEREFDVQQKFLLGLKWARLYGGAGIVLGLDGTGEMHEPLDVERVQRGQLKWLTVLDRYHLVPTRVNSFNPLRAGWDEPEFYRAFSGPDEIHRSRILFFHGVSLPYRLAVRNWFWGGSILDRVMDAVEDAGTAVHGIAQLITEAKVDVFKIPGLFHKLGTPEGTTEIMERIRLLNMGKSINNAVIMDATEEWDQKTGSLSQGLAGLLSQFLEVVAGAAGIPVTRLLGKSPSGLNATGEENTRNYYDHVKHMQESKLGPVLQTMDKVLLRHTLGSEPEEFETTFNSLWQQSETERSQTQLQDQQRDSAYLADGVIAEHHIASRLMREQIYPTYEDADVKELESIAELGPSEPLIPGQGLTPGAPFDPGAADPSGGAPLEP